jgi:hypothetical protein
MTSPGGGEIIVSPDDNYDHVATRRNQAADFFTDKPPPIPDDPGGDDATKGAAGDLTGAVQGTSHGLGRHSIVVADWVEKATNDYVNSDQNNAAQLFAVGGGGGAQKEAATGLTDVGVGAIINSFLNPTGAITGGFEQSLGGYTQGLGGFSQAGGNIAGQLTNAAVQAGEKGAEFEVQHPGALAGLAGTAGAGAGPVSDTKGAGASEAPQTRPVSGVMSPSAAPSATAGRGSDYVHTELQDRNDMTPRPAGMAMGGVPAGLGVAGGGRSGSAATAPTYRITTGNDDDDPAPEPPPAVVDPGSVAAPASVSLPLQKDT